MAYLYNYDKERNNFENTKFYSKSIFINILSILISIAILTICTLLLDKYLYDEEIYVCLINNKIIFVVIFIVFLYLFYRITAEIILFIISSKNPNIIFLISMATLFIIFLISIYVSIKIGNTNKFFSIFFMGIALFLLLNIFILGEKNKKYFFYIVIISLIPFFIGAIGTFSDYIFKWLDFGNINYSYISLDKDVKNTIPIKLINKNDLNQYFCIENLSNKNDRNKTDIEIIYDYNKNNTFEYKNTNGTKIIEYIPKNCFKFINTNNQAMDIKNKIIKYTFINENNESKTEEKALATPEKYLTYIEEKEDVLIIYNIKALSTLGRFWHLETRGGTRFKVESKFII